MIEVPRVTRRFAAGHGEFKLDVEPLKLRRGRLTCLIGRNGSGKSLYLRTLADDVIEGAAPLRRAHFRATGPNSTLLVHQSPDVNVCGSLTVLENFALWAPRGSLRQELMPMPSARKELERFAHVFPAIDSLLDRPASTLSGGQKQCLVLACRFQTRPDLLLLDEITAAVDDLAVPPIFQFLKTELQSAASGCLLVTHDLARASDYADRILVISGGRMIHDFGDVESSPRPSLAELRQIMSE